MRTCCESTLNNVYTKMEYCTAVISLSSNALAFQAVKLLLVLWIDLLDIQTFGSKMSKALGKYVTSVLRSLAYDEILAVYLFSGCHWCQFAPLLVSLALWRRFQLSKSSALRIIIESLRQFDFSNT